MTERHQGSPRAEHDETPRDKILRDEMLSGHLDGMLDPRERALVAQLLAADADAVEALAGLQRARDMVASLDLIPAPRSFAIPAAAGRARGLGWFRGLEWAVRGAAGIAAIGFAVAVVDLGGSPESVAPAGAPAAKAQAFVTVAAAQDAAAPTVVTTVESRTRALTEATTAAPSGGAVAGATGAAGPAAAPNTTTPALAPRTAPAPASTVEASGLVAPASAPAPASGTTETAPARRTEPTAAAPAQSQSSAPDGTAAEVRRSAPVAQPTAAVTQRAAGADAGTTVAATASDEAKSDANAAPLLGGLAGVLTLVAVTLRLARPRVRA